MKEVYLEGKDQENKKIKYYDEFVLINQEIKKDILVNKYRINNCENKFVINQQKIMCLNNHPLYQILIGSLNEENQFLPKTIISFVDGNELNAHFSKLKFVEHNQFLLKLNKNKNNNKINDKLNEREIGEIYYLDENPEIITPANNEDYIKNLIELYYTFDNLNSILKMQIRFYKVKKIII